MPAATPLGIRQEIVNRRQAGETYAAIGRELKVPYVTVRQVYGHYKKSGQLAPHYDRCRHTSVRSDPAVYEQAIQMKREHPSWGAGLIWVELAEHFAEADLPSLRTLQRWFRQAQVQIARREKRVSGAVYRGQQRHEVWAIDAKEQLRLADGSDASWLSITDEASGAILSAAFFPDQTLEQCPTDGRQDLPAGDHASVGASAAHSHG
jgi:hypothetical protein